MRWSKTVFHKFSDTYLFNGDGRRWDPSLVVREEEKMKTPRSEQKTGSSRLKKSTPPTLPSINRNNHRDGIVANNGQSSIIPRGACGSAQLHSSKLEDSRRRTITVF